MQKITTLTGLIKVEIIFKEHAFTDFACKL